MGFFGIKSAGDQGCFETRKEGIKRGIKNWRIEDSLLAQRVDFAKADFFPAAFEEDELCNFGSVWIHYFDLAVAQHQSGERRRGERNAAVKKEFFGLIGALGGKAKGRRVGIACSVVVAGLRFFAARGVSWLLDSA